MAENGKLLHNPRSQALVETGKSMVRAISNRNDDSKTGVFHDFTPDAATKMLPLVRRIVADMVQLSQTLEFRRERLAEIDRLPETIDQPNYREELCDIRRSLVDDEQILDSLRRELATLGLEVHCPFDGSVDFPAVTNRRRVRLCWQSQDEQVEYWHEVGQSSSQRRKIDSQMFGVEALN